MFMGMEGTVRTFMIILFLIWRDLHDCDDNAVYEAIFSSSDFNHVHFNQTKIK